MKNSTLAAFGLLIAVLGLRGIITSALPAYADTSTAPATSAPTAIPTLTSQATITSTGTITTIQALTVTLTVTATRGTATPTQTITETATATTTATLAVTPEVSATVTMTTPTATPTVTPTPTATRYTLSLNPNVLSIDSLRARPYGGGSIKITRVVSDEQPYRRVLIEYPSDGLKITGTMNIPRGLGPFPVVVLDHGYFKPSEYKTGDGTSPAADAFARHGYLTIASDYRCYGGSQCGSNPFDVGYAVDVLNLIADLPSVPDADASHVGIWGHSMGGGVTMRVLAINHTIKVGSLYGAVSSDDEVHYCWLAGCTSPLVTPVPRTAYKLEQFDPDFNQGVPTPAPDAPSDYRGRLHEIFLKSSPSRYLSGMNTPLIIHHGESDDTVPIQWSVDLADRLNALGKVATLYTYPGEGHVFAGWGWQLFMYRTLTFFDNYLDPHATPITVDQRVLQQERVASDLDY